MSKIEEWWKEAHKSKHKRWLTGSPGREVWGFLKIGNFVQPNKTVLNIGAGLGNCTKDLFDKGMITHVLDISPTGLERVKQYTIRTWLPSQLKELPEDTFDLAISHLVTQHVSDEDLLEQMKAVIKSLKSNGLFAMQFATAIIGGNNRQDIEAQMRGCVCRTLEHMEKLIKKAGGEMKLVNEKSYPRANCKWYAIHIERIKEVLEK